MGTYYTTLLVERDLETFWFTFERGDVMVLIPIWILSFNYLLLSQHAPCSLKEWEITKVNILWLKVFLDVYSEFLNTSMTEYI